MGIFNPVNILTYILFVLVRIIFTKFQSIYWKYNGTEKKIHQVKNPEYYNECLHIQNIKFKNRLNEIMPGSKNNFLTTHQMFAHPDYLLASNIHLYDVTQTETIFLETDPGIEVTNPELGSFVRVVQFDHAKKLITMPSQAFLKFAEAMGDPRGEVILLSNTGRCGSTLLTQMFEATGECLSLSEPNCFNNFWSNEKLYHREDFAEIVASCFRFLCKPTEKKHSFYVIKTMNFEMPLIAPLTTTLSQVKHLFMYRNLLPTLKSFYSSFVGSAVQRHFMTMMMTFFPNIMPFEEIIKPTLSECLKPDDLTNILNKYKSSISNPSTMTLFIAMNIALYQHYQKKGLTVAAIKYEDLLERKEKSIKAVFNYCGLKMSLIPKALEAMSRDSQKASVLAKDGRKGADKLPDYVGNFKAEVEAICELLGIAKPGEEELLPNTITHC